VEKNTLILLASILLLSVQTIFAADVKLTTSVLVQGSKFASEATSSNIDKSEVRGEFKAAIAANEKTGGLFHIRLKQGFNNQKSNGDTAALALYLRQAYWDIKAGFLTIRGGRWYSSYTPGAYFGRYLHGTSSAGSGSFCTNYSIVDGLLLSAPIEQIKTDFFVGLLPQDLNFETVRTMIRLKSKPIEQLTLQAGTNLDVVTPDAVDPVHRLMLAANVSIMEQLQVFIEFGNVDMANFSDNSWLMFGLDIPTNNVLDLLRVEAEYKKDRVTASSNDDFAWTAILVKKVKGLKFNLNIGADPKGFGSEDSGGIGVHFRASTKF